ncbi:cellulase family glycosylhydrolase [Massilia sp. erpn]|uniref:cellulase family glycosylhydrolase n=1 Tax=Massilia sp. erpn TaxID=2738142 RepID=UPI0021082A14|nr:cellulase family glycosylhydrolase [Massilia sp. erpn]UTY56377.1 DUF4434 domain-containing protein [Massilia sp. erpn]
MRLSKSVLAAMLSLVFLNASAEPLVVENGLFMHKGKPFYGVGVNYFDGFTRYAKNEKDESWKKGLQIIKKHEIPFIRISTIGFWPETIQSDYLKDEATKREFHRRLNIFMTEADNLGIGVILDVFWNWTALLEITGEHASAIGRDSQTRDLMKKIIDEMVDQHKDHPALWGWEFTNEGSSFMDLTLQRGYQNYPCLPTREGRATPWTPADNFTHQDMISAIEFFAKEISDRDKRTPIFSGNNVPNPNAFSLRYLPKSEGNRKDTEAEFGWILRKNEPDSGNTLSMHLYPEQEGTYFGRKDSGLEDILEAAMARSHKDKRPFYLGEFGAKRKQVSYDADKKIDQFLSAIYNQRIQLSSFWVYDFAHQKDTYSVMAGEGRIPTLEKLQKYNELMRNRAEAVHIEEPPGPAESWPSLAPDSANWTPVLACPLKTAAGAATQN